MGRLRYGETLISKELRNGMSVFPPLPPTKKFSAKTSGQPTESRKPRLRTAKSNVPSPVDEEDENGLMSKLRCFPAKKFGKNNLSYRTRQRNAKAAESVRKALISELMSLDNVESMVYKANNAFASLSSFHADFGDLYDAVRAFISYQCELLEANKELEINGCLQENIAVHRDNLLTRSKQDAKALSGTRTSIAKARKNVAVLMKQIGKTRKLLKELEEKVAQKDMEIDGLEKGFHKLEESYEITKADQQNIAKQIEKERKNAQQISTRSDKARAGIEQTKALLSSLC